MTNDKISISVALTMDHYSAMSSFLRTIGFPSMKSGSGMLLPPPTIHVSKDGVTKRYKVVNTATAPITDGSWQAPGYFVCEVVAVPVEEKENE